MIIIIIGFNQFKKLPVMFVDDFTKLSEKSLENYLETLEVKDLDLIDFNYWKKSPLLDLSLSEIFKGIDEIKRKYKKKLSFNDKLICLILDK